MDTQKLKNVGLKSIIKDKASRERDSVIKIKENVENISYNIKNLNHY